MADFADRVRIKSSEETRRLGLVGLEGVVHGWTTASVTGVEMVDHGAGTVVTLDGVDKEWVRLPNGEWQERLRSDEGST